jgi:ABC-type phosphate transport system substrate-binding protein
MKIMRLIYFFVLVIVFQVTSASLCFAEEVGHSVIVHPHVTSKDLSLNQLRSIFSLRARAWPDGARITVVVLSDEAEIHRSFLVNTLKMLPHQLRRQWDRYIYSGIGQGPVVVNSVEEMMNKVRSTPGAIGYIDGGAPDGQVITLSVR